jgi:hypothetical protein
MEFKYLNTLTLQKHFSEEELRQSYGNIMKPMKEGNHKKQKSNMSNFKLNEL